MIKFVSKLLYKIKNPKVRHAIWVVSAFISTALLFNTNSNHADKNNLNGEYLIVGIIFGLFAIITCIAALKENQG
jgi:hypothetical protein